MKSIKMGILSAISASICCIGPIILIALGFGSLSLGAVINKYHGAFLTVGILLILFSWIRYIKEKKNCHIKKCQMENKKITLITLIITTSIVSFFLILNFYTYAARPLVVDSFTLLADTKTVLIPVKGMTCFTCEVSVSSALKRVNGVISVRASAKEGIALVNYEPDKTGLSQLIKAINNTGFKASLPE
ncbi:MAG: mercuric transporter MerT family protein [Omnitrophica bacterium]|nr:mercuric transporter MerT family protein [Candidatus Omnitrophota bacterium]